MRINRGVLPLALLVLSGGLALSGCNEEQKGGGERPAPDVGIVTLKAEPLTIKTELPGRTSAFRIAEVRPQVSGIILKRNYKEGTDVEAGVSLYQIDPAPFQATYNSAKAELAKAQANANLAALTVKRYKPLLGTNYISQQEYDQANSTYAQSLAAVKAAEAAVESARINLDYTKVTSPISGRTSKSNVTEGALVSAGQATELMRVQQLDPIYVDVTQSSEDFLRLKAEIENGALQKEPGKAPVSLVINNGQEYAQSGQLEFSDVTVDETTGSITMRAVFPNPNKELMPGMFVRAILEDGVKQDAILVPQQGLARTPQGDAQVMVVGAENKVEVRKVKAGQAIGNKWLVTEGLKDGDRVIVLGLQKIKPGMVVVPKQANLETQSIVDTQAKPEQQSK
ncbi:Acriflavine resistance protein A precursor [Providencia rustigianii]|uniref:Acriflavine resistance protein A n=2 Tax=Providencia rustigianii TaxID=158850 RepID=D1P4G9_9GAMM|nr:MULTISPECIES: efflux RND transporter periplasmic adaptor subunit [Providencia]EFB71795.1 acriflavine resistance protein A [Providencia rustigianii DSM 4541]MTC55514.1 efflux RND transporter periplasmic adaptor subunit [Providencia rustigianii]MTC60139.1 efflux RND transporter periplasmic adaptor subunit [Providencia rustigianii]SPY78498.1 Acriflavine resistance protein A precursor [Providencia rustigianii]SUC28129.1 Acriflavine resistance protein A precursor [Providencia rustigianii]